MEGKGLVDGRGQRSDRASWSENTERQQYVINGWLQPASAETYRFTITGHFFRDPVIISLIVS